MQNIKMKEKAKILIDKGKKNGSLTWSEVFNAFSDLELDKDQIDNLYETLGNLGIEIIENKEEKLDINFTKENELELKEIEEEMKNPENSVDLEQLDLSLPKA